MKRLILFGLTVAVLSLGNAAVANTPETSTVTPHKLPSSVINGIEIPFEVLDYAQMKYQGYAVTQATRSFRGGQPAYQLRVDNDDILYDDDCIFLWYDMKWKLLGEDRAAAAPAPTFFRQPETDSTEPRSEPEKPKPEDTSEIRPPRPQPEPEPEPEPKPVEEPEEPEEIIPPRYRGRRE